MLAVTFADLAYRYRQFLIAVVGAGLVLAMALLLAGLATGFTVELQDTVGAVGAQRWILTQNSDGRIAAVGAFSQATAAAVGREHGVRRSDPLAVLPQQVAHLDGQSVTVNVIGARLGGLGDPHVSSGSMLSGPGQVVTDAGVGATVGGRLSMGTRAFAVTGQVEDRTMLGGVPNVYMPLHDAQLLVFGGRPLVTAVVTQGVPTHVPPGLQVLTNQQVESQTLEALQGGISSINNSKVLMWVIAVIIVAALLYVSALQRTRDFAVLKALGSSSSLLLASLTLQAVIVTLAAAAFAMIICNFMGGVFSQPIDIPASAFATLPLIAVVVGVVSSLVAMRRATGADPAAAFGG